MMQFQVFNGKSPATNHVTEGSHCRSILLLLTLMQLRWRTTNKS